MLVGKGISGSAMIRLAALRPVMEFEGMNVIGSIDCCRDKAGKESMCDLRASTRSQGRTGYNCTVVFISTMSENSDK